MDTSDIVVGSDHVARCGWVGSDDEYQRYHDQEWGVPLHGDQALFEKLSLEAFQAGLSWITVLRKRPHFREAFKGFAPELVAEFSDDDVDRLMHDSGIIRNRAKIKATIANARIVEQMQPGEFDELMWSFAPNSAEPWAEHLSQVPASTPESVRASKELKRRGFSFVGPTTMYALMQSAGMVNDHIAGCWRTEGEAA